MTTCSPQRCWKVDSPAAARQRVLDSVREAFEVAGIRHQPLVAELTPVVRDSHSDAYLSVTESVPSDTSALGHAINFTVTIFAKNDDDLNGGFAAVFAALEQSSMDFDIEGYSVPEEGAAGFVAGEETYVVEDL